MNSSTEYQPGVRFAITTKEASLIVDRRVGTATLQTHRVFGGARETVIPIAKLEAATLELVDAPPLSLATAGQIMSNVMAAMKSGHVDQQSLLSEMPKGLAIRIDRVVENGGKSPLEVFCGAPKMSGPGDLVTMARQLADAAGLGYWAVHVTPHAGTEVRLSRRPGERLNRVPAVREGESEAEAAAITSDALGRATVPPFDAEQFRGNHKLTEWRPGIRVAFRRPLSKAAPFVFPFALCGLAGPGLWIAGLVFGGHQDTTGLLIVTAIGLVIGVPATLILGTLLPREVVFDWSARTLSDRTWFRSRVVAFEGIERLILTADTHESSGGESGSSEITYLCRLCAVERGEPGKAGRGHEIVDTDFLKRPEQPLRMAAPLVLELAAAMKVESQIEDYEFRKGRT